MLSRDSVLDLLGGKSFGRDTIFFLLKRQKKAQRFTLSTFLVKYHKNVTSSESYKYKYRMYIQDYFQQCIEANTVTASSVVLAAYENVSKYIVCVCGGGSSNVP